MSAHSPAPWKWWHSPDDLTHDIRDKNGVTIVAWPGFDGLDMPLSRLRANAQLMRSAPKLLAACKKIAAAIVDSGDGRTAVIGHKIPRAIQAVRDAIAEAEGESP